MIETVIELDAVRLNQLLWNATLFTPKTGVAEGRAFFAVSNDKLVMFSCDDFIVTSDVMPSLLLEGGGEPVSFTIPVSALKTLETETRKVTEGTVDLFLHEDNDIWRIMLLGQDVEVAQPAEVWEALTGLHATAMLIQPGHPAPTFYLNPDRMKQIPRMKIEGDHPVAFRYVGQVNDQDTLAFHYGGSVSGMISTMDIAVLKLRGVHVWEDEDDSPPWDE